MTVDEALRAVEVGIEVATRTGARLGQPRHRRHGDRQHHGLGGAGLRVHRSRPRGGHRPRARASTTARWERKVAVVAPGDAPGCPSRPPTPQAAIAALAEVGGLEHAALAGFLLGAAASPHPGDPRRRHRRGGRPRGRRAVPGRAGVRDRGAPVAGGGPCPRAARTSGCGRCWGSTCASARAPARCWRCRWCRRGPGAARRRHLRRRGCHRQDRLTARADPPGPPGIADRPDAPLNPERTVARRSSGRPVRCHGDEEAPWPRPTSRTRTFSSG